MSSKDSKINRYKIKEDGLTYDDYAAIDDGNRYELAGGTLELMSPAPSVSHQLISFEIQKKFAQSCETDYIILNAPVDVILSPFEVRQPDLVLVHKKRINIISKRGIEGTPDLVVEILSPSTLKRDKIDKLQSYSFFGIPEYWVVHPIGILEQYSLINDRYELIDIFQKNDVVTSPTTPCISFTMAEIFSKIPPSLL